MFILEKKIYLWLLLLIPVVFLLYLVFRIWQKQAREKFAKPDLLSLLTPNRSSFKPFLKLLFVLAALASLVLGLVNPKIGSQLETVKREGVDIVFAVDVSKSMLAEDIAPNRLEKSKQLVREIIGNLGSDRIGLIAYAGSAFPQLPITTDYGAGEMFLESLNTDMLSSQGTAIGDAIDLATGFFDDDQKTNRVMFILSDGEDHEGNVEDMAQQAAEAGIRIYTIGVGTAKGGPIPMKQNGVVQKYKENNQGETVITKLDPAILQEIAKETNGEYIDGGVTSEVTEKVQEVLQNIEKTEFEAKQFADYKSQFQWFIGLAIFLLLLDIFILERKTSWVRKLNLFNEKRKTEK